MFGANGKAALLELEATSLTRKLVRLERSRCPLNVVGRSAGRCSRAASLLIAISDNRTRNGDRALPSDHTIVATDVRFARSAGDSHLTLHRAARAGETNRAFARRHLAFSDFSRRAAHRARRIAKRRRGSSKRVHLYR